MKSFIALASLVAVAVNAAPAATQVDDATVLNYALTLEYLESAFYTEALAKYNESAFNASTLPAGSYGWFSQIKEHEAAHVDFLSTNLGSAATKACNYSFPYSSPETFASLSMILEGVGVSAYAGAAQYISDKTYLTAAASVLSTEARHAAFVSGFVRGGAPWSGAEDTPLGLDSVYTLAAGFITGCPSSNPALPVKAFPALNITVSGGNITAGANAQVAYNTTAVSAAANGTSDRYVVFYSGLAAYPIQVNNNAVTIPSNLTGTVYAVLTTTADMATDATTVAGPMILQLYNSSDSANPSQAGTVGNSGKNGNGQAPSGGDNSNNGNGSSGGSSAGVSDLANKSGFAALVAGVLAVAAFAL